jgi:putative NADPH-quinone reductase
MEKRIVVIQGHPSPQQTHLGHALADAYAEGAIAAGHEVRRIEVAQLEFPLLRTADDWKSGALPEGLRDAQAAIGWANHLVLIFPLWTGTMPALLKGFLEQVARPGFAFRGRPDGRRPEPALTGKSARVVVTMGMPAFVFRWFYHSYGVRGLRRSILEFCGIKPVRTIYIGMVDDKRFDAKQWLAKLRALGGRGE